MRSRAVAWALSVACSACSGSGVGAALPATITDGTPVDLRIGGSAQAIDGRLRFGFERVTADSRCPKGVQCVSAGDAVVRLWLQRASGPREIRDLHTAPRAATEADKRPDEIELLRLDPSPVAGRPIDAGDYVATFRISRPAPVGDPER